jgi:hypothetical protein
MADEASVCVCVCVCVRVRVFGNSESYIGCVEECYGRGRSLFIGDLLGEPGFRTSILGTPRDTLWRSMETNHFF